MQNAQAYRAMSGSVTSCDVKWVWVNVSGCVRLWVGVGGCGWGCNAFVKDLQRFLYYLERWEHTAGWSVQTIIQGLAWKDAPEHYPGIKDLQKRNSWHTKCSSSNHDASQEEIPDTKKGRREKDPEKDREKDGRRTGEGWKSYAEQMLRIFRVRILLLSFSRPSPAVCLAPKP